VEELFVVVVEVSFVEYVFAGPVFGFERPSEVRTWDKAPTDLRAVVPSVGCGELRPDWKPIL